MNAAIFTDSASAAAQQASCDASLGYPRPGVDIGGGVHAPPAQTVTVTYFVPLKHPTLAEWAYIVDATTIKYVPNAISAVSLNSTWFPTGTAI